MCIFMLFSGAAEWIVRVNPGDDLFAEDHFASSLDLGFIVPGGVGQDVAEGGMMIERFACGVELEFRAFQGETFARESEVFICDADICGFVLVSLVPGDPTAEFLEGLEVHWGGSEFERFMMHSLLGNTGQQRTLRFVGH